MRPVFQKLSDVVVEQATPRAYSLTWNSHGLIDAYSNYVFLKNARQVFQKIHHKDIAGGGNDVRIF